MTFDVRTPHVHKIRIHILFSQGVYARGLLGNASSAQATMFKAVVDPLADLGCSFIRWVCPPVIFNLDYIIVYNS